MIVLNVTYKCKPGMREEFLEAILHEGIDGASRKEAGNLKYDYYIPFDDNGELLLVEHWRDEEALTAHGQTPHLQRLRELKAEFVTETVIERFELPDGAENGAEEQTVTITVQTQGEMCALSDEEIKTWYEKHVAALFDPQWGMPKITVGLKRKLL